MKITVSKSEIFARVEALTARTGRMVDDYDNIAATSDNYDHLALILSEAVAEGENELRKRLKKSHLLSLTTVGDVELDTRDHVRQDTTVANLLQTNLSLYAAHYIVGAWLGANPTAAELGGTYRQSASDYLAKIISCINQVTTIDVDYTEDKSANDYDADAANGASAGSGYEDRRGDYDADAAKTQGAGSGYEDRRGDYDADAAKTQGAGSSYEDRRGDYDADATKTQGAGSSYEDRRGDYDADAANADKSNNSDYGARKGEYDAHASAASDANAAYKRRNNDHQLVRGHGYMGQTRDGYGDELYDADNNILYNKFN